MSSEASTFRDCFKLQPVGIVRGGRQDFCDDFWGGSAARIELYEEFVGGALQGLEGFSHAEVLFVFDQVDLSTVCLGARHPRGNVTWPSVGIFAQRAKARPNRIGSTIVSIDRVEPSALYVRELDALDGSPVIDIKPVMREFLPRGGVEQPAWATELMRDYWAYGCLGLAGRKP